MENEQVKENEEQQETNEAPENTDNTEAQTDNVDSNDDDEFDPAAFSSITEDEKSEIKTDESEDESTDESDNKDEPADGTSEFEWAGYSEEDDNIDDTTEEVSDDKNTSQDDAGSNEGNQNQDNSSLNDAYKTVASELGLEAESLEDLKQTLESIQKENEELRSNALGGTVNDTIAKLEGFKKKSDQELVELELKKQGFSDEEIQNAVDGYTDNGTLWIEAKKIRNTINGAIKREQEKIVQSEKETQATQEKQRVEAVNALTEYVNGLDTMFGFRMAKDEATLQKVREQHTKYITSGDFLADVTKDNKNLNDAAWLWRNKDVILKAIGSREFNKGKKQILDDIGNPDVSDKSRFKDPGGSDSFDPKAFVYGDS